MENKNKPRFDQWTDFAGKFLKAEFVDSFPLTLVCIAVDGNFDNEGDAHLFLDVEYKSKKWKWELNKTNQKIARNLGIQKPMDFVGKKITYNKIKVFNPGTKQQVDSLSISKIE